MNIRPTNNLADIARKITALRTVSQTANYSLSRTIGGMLDRLSEEELVKLGEILHNNETQQQAK
jgi:hypothetical protein